MTQAPPQPAIEETPANPTFAPAPVSAHDRALARKRFAVVVASHLNVDLYPIFIVALAVALQDRLALTNPQRAMVIAIGPIVSGLCQPLFAWIGDKLNTRLFGPLGLAVGALCISSIGFAQSLPQLLALQIVGLIGVGVYHPIASAVAGKVGRDALHGARYVRSARNTALSIFFLAGMMGGTLGPLIAAAIMSLSNDGEGGDMRWLSVMIAPGLLLAWFLWTATRRVEHKVPKAHEDEHEDPANLKARRRAVALLFASNSFRFIANVGCYFLFTAWARQNYDTAAVATQKGGYLLSATTLGMAVATIVVAFQHAGDERRTLTLTGLLSAPFVVLIPFVPLPMMMLSAFIAASLYFVAVPSAISLSHRLLPHATGMTSSLLMGAGWVLSALGPFVGELIVNSAGDHGLHLAFAFMALMLVLSGLAGWLLDPKLIRDTPDH